MCSFDGGDVVLDSAVSLPVLYLCLRFQAESLGRLLFLQILHGLSTFHSLVLAFPLVYGVMPSFEGLYQAAILQLLVPLGV